MSPLLVLLVAAGSAAGSDAPYPHGTGGGGGVAPISIFVSPDGADSNSGLSKLAPLATCKAAVAAAIKAMAGHPATPIDVIFAAGTYPLTPATACGTITVTATQDAPVVFRGASPGGSVRFDASAGLDVSGLGPISNASIAAIVQPSARGKVLELAVPASAGWTGGSLEWQGTVLTPSTWPNTGLGYVRRVHDVGAVWAAGRTIGPKPVCHPCKADQRSTKAAPCGANVSLAEQPNGDWAAELELGPGFGDVSVSGYFASDWYHETHRVVRVVRSPPNETSLQFASYSRYGICEALEGGCAGVTPGRFTADGLLSEVDTPGEYFFNKVTRMLYVYPLAAWHAEPAHNKGGGGGGSGSGGVSLSYWSGAALVTLQNASWVTFRDFAVQGAAATVVTIDGGSDNTVGGCSITNSDGGIAIAGGHRHRVLGNDIFDVGGHLAISGDPADTLQTMVPSNHLIANNHLTQVRLRGGWSVHLQGQGYRFSKNLLHDSAGQLLLPGGPLAMLDHNEIFNTGYAEGDGGVLYSAASLTAGYGMQYRENFVHHSLEVPGLHGRGGIYFDWHEGSVSNCSGNVMYKAAGRAFLVNGGAANNITRNLIVNGGIGIFNQHADDMTKALPLYDNGTLKRGDMGDFIWRTEASLGVDGFDALFNTTLAARFPTFARLLAVNSTTRGWASAAGSNFADNVFLNNSDGNVCLLLDYHGAEYCDAELAMHDPLGLIDHRGGVNAEWSWFPGAARLEFVNRGLGFDTTGMGLECDGWRTALPAPSLYRPWVKAAFDGVPSAASGPYTPAAAAVRSGLASGAALVQRFTRPCPPLRPRDCRGVWLAWGECEADSTRQMRFTVEDGALAGGAPCADEDGTARTFPCHG